MPFQPRIAIVGGGPSGLALGLLLRQRGISSTIYDLRAKPTPNELAKPSGMLDLHVESGQKVMRECQLWDGFQAALGECSEACRLLTPDGVVLHTDDGDSSRPEISRNALTNLFMNNMPQDFVQWNHKITTVMESNNAKTGATEITLDLGANGTATYDFVVGADGAWSRVRNLLTNVKPYYSGAQLVVVTVRNATKNFPHLVELNGSGMLYALGGKNAIISHRGPQDSIRVYATVTTPHEDWAKANGLEGKTAVQVKDSLLVGDDTPFGKWAPSLKELISIACDEDTKDDPEKPAEMLPLYMLPVGHSWKQHTSATLIGDAAHLMTPWAGEGVNLALWDSLELARALAEVPETEDAAAWQAALEPCLRKYEEEMSVRVKEKAEESDKNKDVMLSENGAEAMAEMFNMYANMAAAGGPPPEGH
ncbi:hypothetical protein ABW20_dc0100957 [Dactylellina cionopaga]|nr:hypothetical protein ABW20_dc0100957 [Dactylellina cionopaga]